MPNIAEIIDSAYRLISRTEQVEIVDAIPTITYKYTICWKVDTEVSVFDKCNPVTFYFGFKQSTPYDFPDVYCHAFDFGDIPHVESNGKLCLYEDCVAPNLDSFPLTVKDTLNKAKILIRQGLEKTNEEDYYEEIISYWTHKYAKEEIFGLLDEILLSDIPTCTQIMYGYQLYTNGYMKLLFSTKDDLETQYCERHLHIEKVRKALYIKDFPISPRPPYCLTGGLLGEIVHSHVDSKIIKRYLNKEARPLVIFNLFKTGLCGGISIDSSKLRKSRPGYRNGTLTNYDILTKMEWKTKSLNRLVAKPYNVQRIIERTSGEDMEEKNFLIIGLGSIGSQLIHFLMAYTRASFFLIDDDILRVENIGRHLLGLKHVGKLKTESLAEHIKEIRPETNVYSKPSDIRRVLHDEKKFNEIVIGKYAFLCTGDYMAERCFLNWLGNQDIHIPVFILWLEPYAISGHLVYISPSEEASEAYYASLFATGTWLYKYNMIKNVEYEQNADKFIKRDAGCNGSYTNYSGNDVMLFLSAMYSYIDMLLNSDMPSACYRWMGNIALAKEKGFRLSSEEHEKGQVSKMQ